MLIPITIISAFAQQNLQPRNSLVSCKQLRSENPYICHIVEANYSPSCKHVSATSSMRMALSAGRRTWARVPKTVQVFGLVSLASHCSCNGCHLSPYKLLRLGSNICKTVLLKSYFKNTSVILLPLLKHSCGKLANVRDKLTMGTTRRLTVTVRFWPNFNGIRRIPPLMPWLRRGIDWDNKIFICLAGQRFIQL